MKPSLQAIALVSLLSITIARAATSSQDLSNAITTWDTRALQVMADQTSDLPQQSLARAVLQAFGGQDAAAIAALEELTASGKLDDGLRFVAFNELGRLHLRNQQYIRAVKEAVNVPLDDGAMGRFEPIIGLSVLRKLGRFEVIQRDGKERLHVGGTSATTGTPATLLLPEGAPVALVRIEPEGAELRMSLDTGANRSALAPAAVAALSTLASRAAQGRTGAANAAGTWTNDAGTLIPQLTLRVGEVAIPLSRVPVGPGAEHLDGTLGQDVFRSGGGYVIDFDRMTVAILPASRSQ